MRSIYFDVAKRSSKNNTIKALTTPKAAEQRKYYVACRTTEVREA
jgi:hypothetical protein